MALEGTLSYLDIAHLLQVVGTSRKSGVLEISWQEREARLYFESGRLIRAESNRGHVGIGTLLVDAGILSPDLLRSALETQRSDPRQRRLGAILCDELGIDPAALQEMLSRQFEQIVFDVFSWPGGRFVFQFSQPEEVLDRFNLNPAEFILEVGVQAGLLAERGVDHEHADPERAPIALLVGDEPIAGACIEFWRQRGHRVVVCERVDVAMAFLEQQAEETLHPVILVDVSDPPIEGDDRMSGLDILDGICSRYPDAVVVALEQAGSTLCSEAKRHGALQVVRKPSQKDLDGPEGASYLEVFLLRLEKTVSRVVGEAVQPQAQAET